MKLGAFDFHVLRQSTFRLDGGAMFGHVPKVVWSKLIPPDEQNRIPLACNCLLLITPDHKIIIDTGMGTKWPPKLAALYDLDARGFDELLKPHCLSPGDIDTVIMTHLHIDHAGGLTTRDAGDLSLAFPKARVYIQSGEWQAANNPDIRSAPSYVADDFQPIKGAGKLELLDGDGEVFPGISVGITSGHTKNHQLVEIESEGQRLVFLGDIMPTVSNLKPNYAMGYDLYPLDVIAYRKSILERYARPDTALIFEHEAGDCYGRLDVIDGKPRFTALPTSPEESP